MACTRKWRELIAGRRWMVAGKWWCPGPCVGGGEACNCFRGALLEGNRRFWHNYTPPDNSWASGGMQYFLGQLGVIRCFTLSTHLHLFPARYSTYGPKVEWALAKAGSSWRAEELCLCFCWLFYHRWLMSHSLRPSLSVLQGDRLKVTT